MIPIPAKSKGAFDVSSLQTINTVKRGQILTADTILNLNTSIVQEPASTHRSSSTASTQQARQAQQTRQPQQQRQTQQAQQTQMITPKPLPPFSNPLQKGQKAVLSSAPVSGIKARLGWNVTTPQCDIDVSAFLLSGSGKVIGDDWFVFYGQTDSPDKSVRFSQINDRNDREMIQVDFHTLNPSVEKIVFVLTINEAFEKKLNFSMVKDAYIRIMDSYTNRELASYQMTDYYANVISMMIGELYMHKGTWKFNAVGNGVAKDLAGLCELYGVQVV